MFAFQIYIVGSLYPGLFFSLFCVFLLLMIEGLLGGRKLLNVCLFKKETHYGCSLWVFAFLLVCVGRYFSHFIDGQQGFYKGNVCS